MQARDAAIGIGGNWNINEKSTVYLFICSMQLFIIWAKFSTLNFDY